MTGQQTLARAVSHHWGADRQGSHRGPNPDLFGPPLVTSEGQVGVLLPRGAEVFEAAGSVINTLPSLFLPPSPSASGRAPTDPLPVVKCITADLDVCIPA